MNIHNSTLFFAVPTLWLLTVAQPAVAQGVFVGLSTEIQEQPIQQDCGDGNPCPPFDCTAELGVDICHFYAEFDGQFPTRLLSVFTSDITASDPFYQHEFGNDFPPPCPFIPLFPDFQCDTFVTVGRENDCNGDITSTDVVFEMGAASITGGWYNADVANDQGHPQPGPTPGVYRVLLAQFAVPQGANVSGEVLVAWHVTGDPKYEAVQYSMAEFSCRAPCAGDLSGDGLVNADDLAALLGAWGPNPGHAADLNGDDQVNAADLALLLANWGTCG